MEIRLEEGVAARISVPKGQRDVFVSPTEQPSVPKDLPLEALRGMASIVVLAEHLILAFIPQYIDLTASLLRGQAWFSLVHGRAAVAFFFVLSGLVLTRRYMLSGDPLILVRSALKRWPRLAGPVLLSVMLSWSLFAGGLYDFEEAGALSGSRWLATFANGMNPPFDPSMLDAVLQGTFFTFFRGDNYFNTNLWTMRFEFIGSFLAFGLALLVFPVRRNLVVSSSLVLLILGLTSLINGFYIAFPIGVALATFLSTQRLPKLSVPVTVALLTVALYLFGYSGTAYGAYAYTGGVIPQTPVHCLAACLLIMAVECSAEARRALSGRAAVMLGDLSFPLYLVHVPIICSVGSFILILSHTSGLSLNVAIVLACLGSALASLLAALPLVVFNVHWLRWIGTAMARLKVAAHTK